MMLNNFKRHNLDEEIYEQLRNGIFGGEFRAGERLIELKLAEKLGVSRTPLREALRRLEAEGLVRTLPQGGLAVSQLDATEIEELFGVREVLEAYAAQLAATKVGPHDMALIEGRHKVMISYNRVEAENFDANLLLTAHNQLHQAIVAAGGNQTLYRLVLDIQQRLARYDAAVLNNFSLQERFVCYDGIAPGEPDFEYNVAGHYLLLDLLRQHDAEAIEKLMHEHIRGQKDLALALLKHEKRNEV